MSDFEWIDPHFQEMSEFVQDANHQWVNDDCGCASNEVAQACIDGRAPTQSNMLAIRTRDISKGWFAPGAGQTVYEVVLDVRTFHPQQGVTLCPETVEFAKPNYALLDAFLVAALRDRHSPCVLNLGNAQKLPGNERNVHWHFVACSGIRSVNGVVSVYISNGDEIPYLGKPLWVTLDDLHAAQLVAVVEYHRPVAPATPKPTPPPASVNGFTVAEKFHPYWQAHSWLGAPLTHAWDSDGETHQVFVYGELGWNQKDSVFLCNVGDNLVKGILPAIPQSAKEPNP